MNADRSKMLADFRLRSFLSHKALRRKPIPRNVIQVINKGISACVSLKYNPIPIGKTVRIPDICSRKPRLAKASPSVQISIVQIA
jgi:hypothetical protein